MSKDEGAMKFESLGIVLDMGAKENDRDLVNVAKWSVRGLAPA